MIRSLVKNLLRANPTRDFPSRSSVDLVLDVDSGQFAGGSLDAPIGAFQALGPATYADWSGPQSGNFTYAEIGTELSFIDGVVDEVVLRFARRPADKRAVTFANCRLVFRGETLDLSVCTTESEVASFLGQAQDTAPLLGRPTLEYSPLGPWVLLFEFLPEPCFLAQLSVCGYQSSESAA